MPGKPGRNLIRRFSPFGTRQSESELWSNSENGRVLWYPLVCLLPDADSVASGNVWPPIEVCENVLRRVKAV